MSESSFDSVTSVRSEMDKPKMGVLYWGGGLEGQGWDLAGRAPGGFPRIDRYSDALVDSWKGRMENAQVTLRMCASEGPGFKRYMKHFLMLSCQACVEFRLRQYHRYNTVNRKKVLTERQVIGGILDCWHRTAANSGMRISNGGPGEPNFLAFLRRRARRYSAQAHKYGGHFAAVILEGGQPELKFVAAAKSLTADRPAKIKRVLLILGGPDGISDKIRTDMQAVLEEYTDFPLLGVALPGGILHSYYALATVLVFHDQGLLIPYLEVQVGKPRQIVKPKARPPVRPEPEKETEALRPEPREEKILPLNLGPVNALGPLGGPKPPSCPPPAHLLAATGPGPKLPGLLKPLAVGVLKPAVPMSGPVTSEPLAEPGVKASPVRPPVTLHPLGVLKMEVRELLDFDQNAVRDSNTCSLCTPVYAASGMSALCAFGEVLAACSA